MGQNAQTARPPRGVITLDWMLLAVGAIAVLLLVGTMVRINAGEDDRVRVGDLFAMDERDNLLAFQDFTFGADGWSPSAMSGRLAGIGPALGPFTNEAVRRAFELPANADTVRIEFNLHMLGDWSERDAVTISLGDVSVLTLRASGPAVDAAAVDGLRVQSDQRRITPQPAENAVPGTAEPFVSHRVRIAMVDPDTTLVLRLVAGMAGDGRWTLDNLAVVATAGDGR